MLNNLCFFKCKRLNSVVRDRWYTLGYTYMCYYVYTNILTYHVMYHFVIIEIKFSSNLCQ